MHVKDLTYCFSPGEQKKTQDADDKAEKESYNFSASGNNFDPDGFFQINLSGTR